MTLVSLVTGAGSGMGRILAQRMAAGGAAVAAVDLDAEGLAVTARRSPNMRTYVCDVSDAATVTETVHAVRRDLGPVRFLGHAAGVCWPGAALEQPLEAFAKTLDINVMGTVNVTRAVVPPMVEAHEGTVVLFGSIVGWLPAPTMAAYAASKFAVTAYAEVLYEELSASGVRVVCVCPPQVDTPLADKVLRDNPDALGGNKPMSPYAVIDSIESALAKQHPPLFVFPGVAKPVSIIRRLAPNFLRTQTVKRIPAMSAAG